MRKVKAQVYVPLHIYEASKEAAGSIGQSFSQFAVFALAQRLRNWEDPITGERVVRAGAAKGRLQSAADAEVAGLHCGHPACENAPARECLAPSLHRGEHWYNLEARLAAKGEGA